LLRVFPVLALALALAPALRLHAQATASGRVDRLREIANRPILNEAAVAQRAKDAAAWLAAAEDPGEMAVLRALARTFVANAEEQQRSRDEIVAYFETHEALPVRGFEEPAGGVVLFDMIGRADAGKWEDCRGRLPMLLRAFPDHQSVFWLLGRRARDAATPEGHHFLHEVVIPNLLADHALDDAERVQILRRLYEVDYTGPKPFVHVAGPGLDGREVRTADHGGRVLLVDYWATWCRPCLMALPSVVEAYRKFHDQGFDVVSISIDDADRRDRVSAKVKELGMDFPCIFDGKGDKSEIALANKVLAIPATFLVDRKGRVRWTCLEGEALQQRVAELLSEK
jgi:thiol-disulfide isomerase/thioredoxin